MNEFILSYLLNELKKLNKNSRVAILYKKFERIFMLVTDNCYKIKNI